MIKSKKPQKMVKQVPTQSPDISVKEEEFFIRDTGPYDVNQQTLSDIERDIADLEEARDLIKKRLKVKKPAAKDSPQSSILTTDMVAAITDTISKELEARLGKKAPKSSKVKKKRKG